ncbi:hypothetical protein C8R44DRAFT_736519 [Mycena epipterygia]|nr:hypothetical protein C8R44DRAFT_736519 [Mycena epipterygia]
MGPLELALIREAQTSAIVKIQGILSPPHHFSVFFTLLISTFIGCSLIAALPASHPGVDVFQPVVYLSGFINVCSSWDASSGLFEPALNSGFSRANTVDPAYGPIPGCELDNDRNCYADALTALIFEATASHALHTVDPNALRDDIRVVHVSHGPALRLRGGCSSDSNNGAVQS